jgi:hypothetical protein
MVIPTVLQQKEKNRGVLLKTRILQISHHSNRTEAIATAIITKHLYSASERLSMTRPLRYLRAAVLQSTTDNVQFYMDSCKLFKCTDTSYLNTIYTLAKANKN